MLMSKKDRVTIYEYLFKEGVMVAMKDPHKPKHGNVDVPNLHVMKALQSLKSRGYVSEQFAWRHHYYTLTNEGITYLRDFLHLPAEIVPSTLKRPTRADVARPRAMAPRQDFSKPEGDRAAYRRAGEGAPDKKSEVGPGAGQLEFRGGFGRGRGMQQ